MKSFLRNHINKLIYLYVFIGFNASNAGSYEDFFAAIKNDNASAVTQLLRRGFDVNTLDSKGQHGLMLAIREPSSKVAMALVSAAKVDVNHLNASGESPLMMAALKGEADLASKLVSKGADVNKTGWTPLHYAASNGHIAVIKLLIENHAYIDAESPNGSTPLMMAAMYGSIESVRLLLDEGADPVLKNQQGLTALEFAKNGKRDESTQLLEKATRSRRATGTW